VTTTTRRARGYAGRTEFERLRIDEAALLDTIAAFDNPYWQDAASQAELQEQVDRIRLRLPDHGARVDARIAEGIRYVQAAPDHRDPVGTVRYVVIHPNGHRIPTNGRTVEDQAAGR